MIDRRKRCLDSLDHGDLRAGLARHHHHLDAEQAGRLDLRIGRGSAAVLGNDDVDAMLPQQSAFVFQRERTTIEDVFDLRERERRLDPIDAADEIKMLRRHFRVVRALPARRQEDTARGGAERFDGCRNAPDLLPAVARLTAPFGAAQSDGSNARGLGRKGGVGGNALGEGMRGVDQQVIFAGFQKIGQRRSTAETTDANWNRLRGRFFRATSQRQKNIAIVARRKRYGEQPRLARPTENQDAGCSHG